MGKFLRHFPGGSSKPDGGDLRTDAQRDRDRILYSTAFRRLAEVTQVVGPLEGHVFHNRLTHTLEVAQLARRLAERLSAQHPALIEEWGGLDPDIAEAASMAHDLGHAPFGHVGEEELDRLVSGQGVADGFEGNAQSFRIVTRLAAHRVPYKGLNLIRGTLNAILKYPWHRRRDRGPRKKQKFGAYRSEAASFKFARGGTKRGLRALEAIVMDLADAIAYSVHDLDDGFRAGLIPLESLHDKEFFTEEIRQFKLGRTVKVRSIDRYAPVLYKVLASLPLSHHRFRGSFLERADLRTSGSVLITGLVASITPMVRKGALVFRMSDDCYVRMRFLQNLVWRYVIKNPGLATQQSGMRRVVKVLFDEYLRAIRAGEPEILPLSFHDALARIDDPETADPVPRRDRRVRLAADIVASLSDAQAFALHRRLTGTDPGSVHDRL